MRSTQQISISLPDEMVSDVRAKVASGEYADESEVIRDALEALQVRQQVLGDWLRTEAVASYRHWKAHPETGRTLEQMRTSLDARAKTRLG